MATCVVVWLWSLVKALRLGRSPTAADRLALDGVQQFDTETGELIIHGELVSVSKALVRSIRQPAGGLFGTLFKVTEHSSDRLAIEKAGPLIRNQPAGLYFSEAEFSFASAGHDTVRVSYLIGYTRLTRLFKKIALGIILGVGLPIILIVGSIIWLFVVQSQHAVVRWQVFQTLQIAHALWPPFLFMWLYARGRRRSKSFVENLIASADQQAS